ncbi:hypothetical protein KKH3_32170 [Pectobacterium actinidiae]|nr:hypothetical protein KKH3_32170 [Pectobacterium actinidiae]
MLERFLTTTMFLDQGLIIGALLPTFRGKGKLISLIYMMVCSG